MSDGIKRLDSLRNLYKAQSGLSGSAVLGELKQITAELKIANNQNSADEKPITTSTNSPYLPDQPFYDKEALYNSPEEVDWKKVRSYEETKQNALVIRNLKKLNII